jgi:hypothetical protein
VNFEEFLGIFRKFTIISGLKEISKTFQEFYEIPVISGVSYEFQEYLVIQEFFEHQPLGNEIKSNYSKILRNFRNF